MKGFFEHNPPVFPVEPVRTGRKSDFSVAGLLIQHLEEHMPDARHSNHEGVGNKGRRYVCHVCRSEHGVGNSGRRPKLKRRWANIDSDRPGAGRFATHRLGRTRELPINYIPSLLIELGKTVRARLELLPNLKTPIKLLSIRTPASVILWIGVELGRLLRPLSPTAAACSVF